MWIAVLFRLFIMEMRLLYVLWFSDTLIHIFYNSTSFAHKNQMAFLGIQKKNIRAAIIGRNIFAKGHLLGISCNLFSRSFSLVTYAGSVTITINAGCICHVVYTRPLISAAKLHKNKRALCYITKRFFEYNSLKLHVIPSNWQVFQVCCLCFQQLT